MPKFLSTILKQKKLFSLIFLFLVLSGIIIPQLTIASSWNPWNPEFYLTDDGQLTGLGSNINTAVDNFGEAVMVPFAATTLAVGVILVVVFGTLSVLAATLLTTIIAMDVGCYTCMSNLAIATGWPAVRDLANMVIVLGFVVIGIATTLRFKDYEAKKLLPKLIIAALLINFSLVICGIFIDGSNIMAKSFNKSGGFFERSWTQTINDQTSKIWAEWKGKSYKEAATGILGAATGLTFYNIMAIVIFFLYAFLYLFRHMALWILVILSPLAFVCYVFPATKKFFDMWWSNFFNWCIIVVPISFFVWIADTIMSGISKAAGSNSPPILSYLIPGFFMLIGFIFSLKISAMGASSAIGLAKGAIGLSGKAGMGALKGLGKGADAATGGRLSSAGQKISSGVGRTMEALGFRKAGATAQSRAKELGESENRYSALVAQGDLARVQRIAKGEGVRVTPKERAGAVAALLKSKNFDSSDAKQVAGLNYFQNQGGNLGEYSAKDPRLAKHDISATRNTMAKNPTFTETEAQQHNVNTAYSRLGVRGMRDLPANTMDLNYLRNVSAIKNDKAAEEFSVEQIAQQKKYVTPGTEENNKLRTMQSDLQARANTLRG